MAERALITGGSGYFGCLLRDCLRAAGVEVRIFDRIDVEDRPPEVELLRGDIRDPEAIARACIGMDVVYHNIAQVPLAKDRELFWRVNRDGTANLLQAVRRTGVRKLVHTSSSAVYGVPPVNPVDESSERRPGEAYGEAKLAAEDLVAEAARAGDIDATIIRPRTILGHGRLGIFQILFEWVSEGRRIPVLGKGDNLYQFVHADDLADACIRAAARAGFASYNIGTDRFGTMRELLEGLCAHAATGSSVRSVPMSLAVAAMRLTSVLGVSPLGDYHALMYGRSLYFETSRAKSDLGWAPRWSNDEMMCQSYEWYLAHRAEIGGASHRSAHRSAVNQGILRLWKHLF